MTINEVKSFAERNHLELEVIENLLISITEDPMIWSNFNSINLEMLRVDYSLSMSVVIEIVITLIESGITDVNELFDLVEEVCDFYGTELDRKRKYNTYGVISVNKVVEYVLNNAYSKKKSSIPYSGDDERFDDLAHVNQNLAAEDYYAIEEESFGK